GAAAERASVACLPGSQAGAERTDDDRTERCRSDRTGRSRKLLFPLRETGGSNPSSSASESVLNCELSRLYERYPRHRHQGDPHPEREGPAVRIPFAPAESRVQPDLAPWNRSPRNRRGCAVVANPISYVSKAAMMVVAGV